MAIQRYDSKGWFLDNTEGVPVTRFSLFEEGFTTRPTDLPANAEFKPRLVNQESFFIRKRARFWPIDGHGESDDASYGEAQIDNRDGKYTFLRRADLRDSKFEILTPPAQAYADAAALKTAEPIATAILDGATSDNAIITLTLRDTIAQNDRPALMRSFPPFVDDGVAMRSLPLLLGACYNVTPPAVDIARDIYQLGDAAVTNMTAVRDGGALLDVHANPPQYGPVENMTRLQLDTPAVKKLSVDCSSVGAQSPIPGNADILAGAGLLTSWPNASNPPTGWTYGNVAYGSIIRYDSSNSIKNYVAAIDTRKNYRPASSSFGQWMYYPAGLAPGRTYRISIKVVRAFGNYGQEGGLLLRTDLTSNGLGSISGDDPLTSPQFSAQDYTFTYTCPAGANRGIYVIGVGDPNFAASFRTLWTDLVIEELGQFVQLPMQGITLTNYLREILDNRGTDTLTAWSVADAQSIDASAGYTIGRYFATAPNRLDAIQEALDSFCAGKFIDSTGAMRFVRLQDPRLLVPTFDLDETVIKGRVRVRQCNAEFLTTRIGVRRNWSPYSDSDFVTDDVGLPIEMRERFKRTSQFERTSTIAPAGLYASVINAPTFHSLLHEEDPAQREIDRVVKMFSPQVYPDGTVSTGKREIVTIPVRFDDPESFGATMKAAVRDVLPGSVGSITYADEGYTRVPFFVLGTMLYPAAGLMELEVFI